MKQLISIVTVAVLVTSAPAFAGGGWNEQGDAGELPATRQLTTGMGVLTTINGSIASTVDVDMYCIHIDGNYSAAVCGADWDTQLWLFETDGTGIRFRDDACGAIGLQSALGEFQPPPGDYLLAISGYDRDALNSLGNAIWVDTPYDTERPPDDTLGMLMPEVASWDGVGALGSYQIALAGVSYCDQVVPVQPTTWGSIKAAYSQ